MRLLFQSNLSPRRFRFLLGLNNLAKWSDGAWFKLIGEGLVTTVEICDKREFANEERSESFVYSASPCNPGNEFPNDATCIALSRANSGNCYSFTWEALTGVEYYIVVAALPYAELPLVAFDLKVRDNSLCSHAVPLTVGADQRTRGVIGATSVAPSYPEGSCGSAPAIQGPAVWFSMQGNGNTLTFDTCGTTAFDSKVSVFEGSCGGLQCVAGNDNAHGCLRQGSVSWSSRVGTVYYIVVHGGSGLFEYSTGTSPANDICEGAAPFPPLELGIDGVRSTSVSGNFAGATVRSDAQFFYDDSMFSPIGCNQGTYFGSVPGVWYHLPEIATGSVVKVDACNSPATWGIIVVRVPMNPCDVLPELDLSICYCSEIACVPNIEYSCDNAIATFTANLFDQYMVFIHGNIEDANQRFNILLEVLDNQ